MSNREYGLGFRSFIVGIIFAALWLVFTGANEFSQMQVIGACTNFVLICAELTFWGYRQRLTAKRVITRVSAGLTLAIGAAFAAISAPFDETGLWGVGLIFIAIGSYAGAALVSSIVLALLNLSHLRQQ